MNALPATSLRAVLADLTARLSELAEALRRPERDLLADRLVVSPGALLTPTAAARLLPMGDGAGLAWLRREGLIRVVDGREVVVWADVLAALPEPPRTAAPVAARATTRSPGRRRGGGL